MKRFMKNLSILSLAILAAGASLFFYARKIEPFRITVETLALETGLPQPIRAIQISDIQISESYQAGDFQKVVRRINQLKPDLCLFTGDLYENYSQYQEEEALIEGLSSIEATYGKYAVWGNRDYGGGAVRHFERMMEASGFTVLCNEAISIMLNDGERLLLAGLDDALLGAPDITPILAQMAEGDPYRILMLHEPDAAIPYADMGFDLILAGHSHGGQVTIPGLKLYTTSLAQTYTKGLYDLHAENGAKLYVNRGIGTSHYQIRLFTPPEITQIELKQRRDQP